MVLTDSSNNTPPYRVAVTEDMHSEEEESEEPSEEPSEDGYYHYHYNHYNHYNYKHINKPDDVESLISEPTKKRVRNIDPNDGRCLIENVDYQGVAYCYCFPIHVPDSQPELLENIEWFWNLSYISLNLQSSRNVFRVGRSIKQLYQKHFWLLLPEESIINQYHDSLTEVDGVWTARRESFPIIPDRNDFEYRFIPISDHMQKIAVSRQLRHLTSYNSSPLSPADFIVLVYPFSGMPILKSHVHPKYVILEAGRKLAKRVAPEKSALLLEEYPIMKKVVQIYTAWTAPRPDNAMEDSDYHQVESQKDNNEEEEDDEAIDGTGERREDDDEDDEDESHSGDMDTSVKVNTANAEDGMTVDPDDVEHLQRNLKRKHSLSKSSGMT